MSVRLPNKVIQVESDGYAIEFDDIAVSPTAPQPPHAPAGASKAGTSFHFDISEKKQRGESKKTCVGQCGEKGQWRYVTRDFVCPECRQKAPHKLITRSKAKATYGLTFEELHEAFLAKKIRMITAKNPHGRGMPPMRLYYEHEIAHLKKKQ